MRIVFVAAPFRAATEWERAENVRAAERHALDVWLAGHVAVCPQANSARFQDSAPDEVFLEGYKRLLKRCDVVFVPGKISEGVDAEIDEAKRAGIRVVFRVEDI